MEAKIYRSEKMKEADYNYLLQKLQFNDNVRNQLLMFAFTAVLTILGVIMGVDKASISPWMCLLPFCLIIPFAARISYYRIVSAHIEAYMTTFMPENVPYICGAGIVCENYGWIYNWLIRWLVNGEMLMLSLATDLALYYCIASTDVFVSNAKESVAQIAASCIATGIVCIISFSTMSYAKLLKHFKSQWDEYGQTKVSQEESH